MMSDSFFNGMQTLYDQLLMRSIPAAPFFSSEFIKFFIYDLASS